MLMLANNYLQYSSSYLGVVRHSPTCRSVAWLILQYALGMPLGVTPNVASSTTMCILTWWRGDGHSLAGNRSVTGTQELIVVERCKFEAFSGISITNQRLLVDRSQFSQAGLAIKLVSQVLVVERERSIHPTQANRLPSMVPLLQYV